MIYSVILAGGSGNRLWPESRPERPKQFLKFSDDQTLLRATADRIARLVPPERLLIATGKPFVSLVQESLPEMRPSQILVEPAQRNTAPCIGLAAVRIMRDDPNATMIVLPADHVIKEEKLFCDTLRFAAELVEENHERLITLGIKPHFPSTSYGYINCGERLSSVLAKKWESTSVPYTAALFHEKPDSEKTQAFYESGRFLWNAGIFVWKAKTILHKLRQYEPEMTKHLDTIADSAIKPDFSDILDKEFLAMKSISIDYAVMEKAENVLVLESRFDWDDLGTWTAWERLHSADRDANGNLTNGVSFIAVHSERNLVRSHDPNHLFALVGIDDLIVIHTAEATLIARKNQEESVREALDALKQYGENYVERGFIPS